MSGWFTQPTIPLTNGCAALPLKWNGSGSVCVCDDQHAGCVGAKLASHHSVDCAFISSRHTLMSTGSMIHPSPPKSQPYIIILVSGLCFHSVLSLSLLHQHLSSLHLKKTCHYRPAHFIEVIHNNRVVCAPTAPDYEATVSFPSRKQLLFCL